MLLILFSPLLLFGGLLLLGLVLGAIANPLAALRLVGLALSAVVCLVALVVLLAGIPLHLNGEAMAWAFGVVMGSGKVFDWLLHLD